MVFHQAHGSSLLFSTIRVFRSLSTTKPRHGFLPYLSKRQISSSTLQYIDEKKVKMPASQIKVMLLKATEGQVDEDPFDSSENNNTLPAKSKKVKAEHGGEELAAK